MLKGLFAEAFLNTKRPRILSGLFLYYLSPVFELSDMKKVETKGLNRGAIFARQFF